VRGAVYFAVGRRKYLKWARKSARSLKKHMPSLPITLFTDAPGVRSQWFDTVNELDSVSASLRNDKIFALKHSPYKATLAMDADTWVCGDLSEIFEALEDDNVDFMAAIAQQYRYMGKSEWIYEEVGVPRLFPHYAGSLIALAGNSRTALFLDRWADCYRRLVPKWEARWKARSSAPPPGCPNQPPLRLALYLSPEMRTAPLHNCYDYLLYGYFNRPIKIIHAKGSEQDFKGWEAEANRHPNSPRCLFGGKCVERLIQ